MGVTGPEAMRDALAAGARPMGDPNLFGAGILSASESAVKIFWSHLGIRALALLVLAGLVARRIQKRGGKLGSWVAVLPGAMLGATGLLFFLPLVHALPRLGQHRWIGELLMRPVGEWDLVFDAGLHKWLPLASALPAVVATAVLYGMKSLRATLGGFALGSAALMTQLAWAGDVGTPFGATLTRIWLAGNVALCLWLARVVLDHKRA
jgi:hypothetical protein